MFNVWGHLLSSMTEWGLGVERVGNHCFKGFIYPGFIDRLVYIDNTVDSA